MAKNQYEIFKKVDQDLPLSGREGLGLDNGMVLMVAATYDEKAGEVSRDLHIIDSSLPVEKRKVPLGRIVSRNKGGMLCSGHVGYTDDWVVAYTTNTRLERDINAIYDVKNHRLVPVNELSKTYLQIMEEELNKEDTKESGMRR